MSLLKKISLLAPMLFCAFAPAQSIPVSTASKHINERVTVCGTIAETHTVTSLAGIPTFIDFEKPYPNQTLTAVVWQRDSVKVGNVPKSGSLCVTGVITEYHGRPAVVLHGSSDWSVPRTTLSNNNHYTNVDGQPVHSPAYSSGGVPAGATAQCADGSYSFSQHRQGTCSHHGGVTRWLN